MLSFVNDYSEGTHEKILQRLMETNRESLDGYGADPYSESAKQKIRSACACSQADIYFLAGGTQTNQVVIDALLNKYEGVVAASTGHVNTHEAGAIEYTGHKVLEIPHQDGKLIPGALETYLKSFYQDENHEHMVFPGMAYISHPTEYGTLYTKGELRELSAICKEYGIPLYLDGARLGYGLACPGTDVALPDVARYCDAFYIGGTKVGALCGEAVVFTEENTPRHFVNLLKKHGALLAKGRLPGIQFDTLFTDGLYLELGRHAIRMAELLREGFAEKGYTFYIPSPTNQLFLILEDKQMERLKENVKFSFWEKQDESHTVVRFATSWATEEREVRELISLL